MTNPRNPTGQKLKVGDTLYLFDGNRRVRGKDGACIYREHFRPYEITGENRTSWLFGPYGGSCLKKTLVSAKSTQFGMNGFFTADGMEVDIWLHDHRYKIGKLVADASYDQLQEIAKILGYKPEGE